MENINAELQQRIDAGEDRCHHTRAMALGTFYLDAGGEGAVGTVGEIGLINDSAHATAHSFLYD